MKHFRRAVPVVSAVFFALGVVAFFLGQQERDTDHVGNHAVVDVAATTEVQSAVKHTLTRVFSHDHEDPEASRAAADRLLGGQARSEYDTLYEQFEQKAEGQRLVFTAEVVTSAVRELDENAATLLVFVDQASQRMSDEESTVSAAQLRVSAEKVDGNWLITGLEPL